MAKAKPFKTYVAVKELGRVEDDTVLKEDEYNIFGFLVRINTFNSVPAVLKFYPRHIKHKVWDRLKKPEGIYKSGGLTIRKSERLKSNDI